MSKKTNKLVSKSVYAFIFILFLGIGLVFVNATEIRQINFNKVDSNENETLKFYEDETKKNNSEVELVLEKETQVSEIEFIFTEQEVNAMAKLVYQEARGVDVTGQAAVVWTVLNRLDNGYWGNTVLEIIAYPNQFAHTGSAPVVEEFYDLSYDVMYRYLQEKQGVENVGRVLPKEYLYFWGDNNVNYFRVKYDVFDNWNWSLPSPY